MKQLIKFYKWLAKPLDYLIASLLYSLAAIGTILFFCLPLIFWLTLIWVGSIIVKHVFFV